MGGDPVVAVRGASKRYGRVKALNGVSLSIGRGEKVVLAGPNGSGKSTLIKVMLGIVRPDSGDVRVFSLKPGEIPASERLRRIGYVPEREGVPAFMRVRDYLDLVAAVRGCSEWGEEARALGIRGVADRRIGGLSQGYRRRVSIAAAVICSPELLVLDEPLANLDPGSRIRIGDFLASIGGDVTMVMSTHILPRSLKARIIVMDAGSVVAEIEPGSLELLILRCEGDVVEVRDVAEATRLVGEGCTIESVRCMDLDDVLKRAVRA